MTPTDSPNPSPGGRPDLRPDLETDLGPDVSVVINTCDRCVPLRSVLHALRRQTYRRFEVVVVVGPTHDDTLEMLDEEFGERVHVARCAEFNLSVSRNVGVRHAAGEVLAFIDDDSVPSPTWLEQLAAAYAANPQAAGVGGRTYLVAPDESESGVQFLSGLVSVLAEQDDVRWNVEAPPEVVPASNTPDECWYPRFHGTNMSYRRRALVELGGFDERFEYLFDDADTAVRFGLARRELVQLRQGVVYHVPASGRNRGDKSRYDLNYYCWLRSTIYFCLKNGRRALGLRRSLWKALRHTSHFYTVVSDLVEQGEIGEGLRRKILPQLRRGWREGLWTGLFGRRRLPADLEPVPRTFQPFLHPATSYADRHLAATPLVGPRSQPVKTLDAPPLRIALLSVGYPPASTEGVARSTEVLAKGLANLGHEVHVVTLGKERRTLLRDGVYVHEIRSVPRRRYATLGDCDGEDYATVTEWLDWSHSAYDEVRELLHNHRIQLVDTPLWNLDGLVTAISGERPVVVRVVTAMRQIKDFAHGDQPEEHRLLGDLEAELLERASAVVSNTRATAQTLERVYDFDTSDPRHEVVLYGIDPVEETRLAPDAATGESGALEDEIRVLFVGRLESRKGILDLFDAIPKVLAKHHDVRFLLAGSDNSSHDGFHDTHGTDYPRWFAKQHPKLVRRVDFLGYVPDEDLDRLYRDCDLLVAPSLYESFGLIYLEAMNYARPAIGCRAGGPQEIIVDGETGRLVPPGDGDALAEAISEIVAMGPARRELGRAGRSRLLERFTQASMAAGFEGVYRRTLQRSLDPTDRLAPGHDASHISTEYDTTSQQTMTSGPPPLLAVAPGSAEVLEMVRQSLKDGASGFGSRSRAAEYLERARELQREFRQHPVGGRLTPIKKAVHWWTASAFDRQAKAVEALIDAVEELAAAESISRAMPGAEATQQDLGGGSGQPDSLSCIREVDAEMQMGERLVLYSLVFGMRPERTLEIGTFQGGSAALICAALRDLGAGRLICLDPEPRVLAHNAQWMGDFATVLRGPSPDVLDEARHAAGGLFDLVLIDGDHSKEGVVRDVEGVLPHLADEAHILFHDCHYAYVQAGIQQSLANHPNHLVDAGLVSVEQNLTDEVDERGTRVIWGGLRLLRFTRRPLSIGG